MLTHLNVIYSLYSIIKYLNLNDHDRILSILPLSFDYGLYQPLIAVAVGCTAILYHGTQSPHHILAAVRDLHVTVLPVVPSIAASIERVMRGSPELRPKKLRTVTNTGGHLPFPLIERLRTVLPEAKVYAMYGLTECKRALYLPPEDVERKPNSVGLPIPGVDARVFVTRRETLGANSADLIWVEAEAGEVGQLFVRGPNVMQGYVTADGSTSNPIWTGGYRDDVWLATGDLFYRDSDGYLYFVSRQKDLIKQDGLSMGAAEIESAILALDPSIEAVCTAADEDFDGIEIAHAFVKLSENCEEMEQRVRSEIATNLSKRSRPRRVTFVKEMPLSPNGKYDRAALLASSRLLNGRGP
jgi:acyl-CoA synthetase (AMP-forming)/AMP-acid ligase II